MTEKILLMSDIHITEPGVAIVGLNPALRFKRCLEHAAIHHSDASHLFIMGDLTHNGSCNEYVVLKEILGSQPFEATLMLGNHDRREPFAKTFNHLSEGFQHGKKTFGKTEIIYLDTLDEGAKNEHSGFICEERLQWLESNLQSGNGPILLLSHHHMLFSGFYGMDEIRLINGKKVAEIILSSGHCQMIINGHVHRNFVASYRGLAHVSIQSSCHQMPMVLGPGSSSLATPEPGGYSILLLDEEFPILHHVTVDLPKSEIGYASDT